jgi:hypothetical protein
MQMAMTFMAVVAGMVFSLAVALLAEEFIFGHVFRLFFIRQSVRQTAPAKTGDEFAAAVNPTHDVYRGVLNGEI